MQFFEGWQTAQVNDCQTTKSVVGEVQTGEEGEVAWAQSHFYYSIERKL